MPILKRTAFSSDCSKFACIDEKDDLLIWDTASNKLINSDFVWKVNASTCIRWIPLQDKHNNTKKGKRHNISNEVLLAVSTSKGDVLIYNIEIKNLYLHLASRHQDAINDMCFHVYNNSLFTCSKDQHIAECEISTGKQISKWKADENPIYSICVIDENNMLSSSNVIMWWDISKKTVLRKFSGHATEIRKLLPVNVDSMQSCHFLSAAIDDTKIKAWLLSSESDACVALFSLPFSPEDMDVSKVSSENEQLRLLTATKDGHLYLFEHILNGNITKLVEPKASLEIDTECTDFSVLSIKLTEDTNQCIIAYGSNESTIAFKHVEIKELLQKSGKENAGSLNSDFSTKLSLASCSSKVENIPPVNELSHSVFNGCKPKLRSTVKCSSQEPGLVDTTEKEISSASHLNAIENLDLDNPESVANALLEAVKTQNSNIIETIVDTGDTEFRSSVIQLLPSSSLKIVFEELNRMLLQKYSLTVITYIKEIIQGHLEYLLHPQCDVTTTECLRQTKSYLTSFNINQTLHKMKALEGLLNSIEQDYSDSESENDSGDDEFMYS